MARTRWWSKSRGLPDAAYDAWLTSMSTEPSRPTRILAWAEAEQGLVIASPAALSTSTAGDLWTHIGWHAIESGGWNAETHSLTWAQYGGRRGAVRLTAPGRLPELFRERIAASIVVERFVPVAGERGVILNGRRDLAQSNPVIEWHTTLGRGVSWRTPGLRETADAALAELKREYDPGPYPSGLPAIDELPRLDSNQQPFG